MFPTGTEKLLKTMSNGSSNVSERLVSDESCWSILPSPNSGCRLFESLRRASNQFWGQVTLQADGVGSFWPSSRERLRFHWTNDFLGRGEPCTGSRVLTT